MLNKLLLALALASLTFYAGCTFHPGGQDRALFGGIGSSEEYFGPETLEERIARADVIVRGRRCPRPRRRSGGQALPTTSEWWNSGSRSWSICGEAAQGSLWL